MTTPTTAAGRALLDASTKSRPWRRSGPGPEPDGDQIWLVAGRQAQFIAWTDASLPAMADFDLMAYAVNALPHLLDTADALAALVAAEDHAAAVRWRGVFPLRPGSKTQRDYEAAQEQLAAAFEQARAIIERLRGEAP